MQCSKSRRDEGQEGGSQTAPAAHGQLIPLALLLLPIGSRGCMRACLLGRRLAYAQLLLHQGSSSPSLIASAASRRGYRGAGGMEGCKLCTVGCCPTPHGYGPEVSPYELIPSFTNYPYIFKKPFSCYAQTRVARPLLATSRGWGGGGNYQKWVGGPGNVASHVDMSLLAYTTINTITLCCHSNALIFGAKSLW